MKATRQTASYRRLSFLQAALDLFSTQGFDGTTTRTVAESAGVTEALLFKHFRTKQELLRAVVEEFGPRSLFRPPPDSLRALPARAALGQFITQYLDTFWANRACLRMMLMATERDQVVFEEIRTQFGKQTLALYTLLQERIEQGELLPSTAVAATDVISAATSGFLMRTLSQEPDDWEKARSAFLNHLLQILFGGVGAEGSEPVA